MRIIAALDVTRDSTGLISIATRMAVDIKAELATLLVEDIDLLRLAELPFAREIDLLSATEAPFTREVVEHTLHASSERLRTLLARDVESLPLLWSCEVVRGQYIAAALGAAGEMDMVLLNRSSRRLLSAGWNPALRPRTVVPAAPVWAFYDGSPAGERVLEMARHAARLGGAPLIVLLGGEATDEARIREQASTLLSGDRARFVKTAAVDMAAMAGAVSREGCSLLLLPRAGVPPGERAFRQLLEQIGCPVMLVP